jgi:hypothetical protein
MEFIQILFVVVYLGTPVLIVRWWLRLSESAPPRPTWPMSVALGLWLLQAAVGVYAMSRCIGGHCNLTPMEENAPVALVAGSYLGIGGLLWHAWRQLRERQ